MKNIIKFVYLDIGGVLIEDFSATNKWDLMTDEWGIRKEKKEELNRLFDEFEKEVCLGRSVEDFLPIVEKKFGVKFSENYSLNQDFVNRFYKNEGLEKIIMELKDKYNFGLLTNMYPGMLDLINKSDLLPKNIWKMVIDSSVEKCRKPEEKIYERAQDKVKVNVKEILFVDNKKDNLEIPKKMGWQTFWFDSGNYEKSNRELEEFLKSTP